MEIVSLSYLFGCAACRLSRPFVTLTRDARRTAAAAAGVNYTKMRNDTVAAWRTGGGEEGRQVRREGGDGWGRR